LIELAVFASSSKKLVVEFGILEGFSLKIFEEMCDKDCVIQAFDIFENFNGNGAKRDIEKLFTNDNVSIFEGDLFYLENHFENKSIDILHIDIANDGYVYEFVFQNYVSKIREGGMIIFEGGSKERDEVEWMVKYNKPKIQCVIEKYRDKGFDIKTFGSVPSITFVKF